MAKLYLIILFLIFFTPVPGQVLQHGLIMPEQVEQEGICCVYSPKEGFSIYDRPGGAKTGILTRNIEQRIGFESYYQIYFVDAQTGKATQIGLDHFQEVGYKVWAVSYFERRNGFVRITDAAREYWISEREIDKHGFKLIEWQDFLSENAGFLTGFFANSPGLNLREGPDTDSLVIMALRGTTNQILPAKEHSGPWTKVKVIIYKENPCETNLSIERNIKEEHEGWIKIVDDYGKPNVWFYPRGC